MNMKAKIEIEVSSEEETRTLHVRIVRGKIPALLHAEIIGATQDWIAYESGMAGTRFDRFRVEAEVEVETRTKTEQEGEDGHEG